ncbi:Hypothetical predicted protein [Paramuricea clavata]|uniref:Uncharacterized protein n=1 Tax=Paramuricea clavata TaxID=317549 RepID=A0A7D9HWC1_PARCT|nr:Hypothetical predicted protein [Paramuricea clavata]
MDLPTITSSNPKKIHYFSDRLTHAVHALETLKKLETVNGYVPMTLNKLSGIRGDLVRTDPDWESWDFAKLSEAVRIYGYGHDEIRVATIKRMICNWEEEI